MFKLVVKLSEVPDGETITKLSGSYRYRVCRNVSKLSVQYEGQQVPLSKVTKLTLLVSDDKRISLQEDDIDVIWHISQYDLQNIIYDLDAE